MRGSLEPSGERLNILIHVEKICRIVFRLDLLEALVVWTIGGDHWITRLVVA